MANPSCDAFSSINGALTQANMGQLNITSYIAACPNVCTLAWGTGNPDLSGIGANISYILQAILTFIFGPLFCWVYAHREQWSFSDKMKENLKSLQATFHDISAQFSIPVAAAAVVRFLQHAPFYELAFLRSLTTLQFLSLLSSSVTAGIFGEREDEDRENEDRSRLTKHHEGLRVTILVFYGLLEFGLYMGLIGGLRTSQASWQTLSELGESCTAYNRIEPWIQYIPAKTVNLPHLTVKQYFNPLYIQHRVIFGLIITGLFIAGIIALVLASFILYKIFLILASKDVFVLGTISLAFSIAVLVEVVRMERTRNVMKNVTGAEFQDNQWGFGQVIAAFLWVPLFFQIFYNIFLIMFKSNTRNLEPTNDIASEPGKTTPAIEDKTQTEAELNTHPEEKSQVDDKIHTEEMTQSGDEVQSEKVEVGVSVGSSDVCA